MVNRNVFEQVGLFSEDYFMYTEDIDLNYKVHMKGYLNYYVSDATIVHFGGGSSKKVSYSSSVVMLHESISKYFRKTRGNLYCSLYRAAILLSALCRIAALAMIFPVVYVHRRCNPLRSSFQKWGTVTRWCLYQGKWINKLVSEKAQYKTTTP